jgi:hypothetical protein
MYIVYVIMYMRKLESAMATSATVRHKHIRIDQAKLDKARRVLAAATETEALDRALRLVVSEAEIDAALRRASRKGRLKKLFR